MKKLLTAIFAAMLAMVPVLFSGCDLGIPEEDRRGGIEIYTGVVRLTHGGVGETYMIVRRNQQLRATSPAGHRLVWSSDDTTIVDVDQRGFILVGQSPHMTATITVMSPVDPSLRADLTIHTRALR